MTPDVEGESTEETPLLQHGTRGTATPFPVFQYSILMLTQFMEPAVAFCLCPFIAEIVRNLDGVDGDERKVGMRVGAIQSLFFVAEACTVLHWGRLSDRIGRRPVLSLGLSGIAISMTLFGLSRTFWTLVISRCLCGFLNGNNGVMKSMIAEITDETNVAQASAMLPIVWAMGCTLGPFIGGQLAHPADRFPGVFGDIKFWEEYPYFLPCAVIAGFACLAFVIVALFLKETVRTGDSLTAKGGTDRSSLSMKEAITPLVRIAVANYAALALLDLAHVSLQPVFYSTKVELGGLGLSVPTIGLAMGITGVWNGLCMVLFFRKVHAWFGTRKVFAAGVAAFVPMTTLFPILNLLARRTGYGTQTMLALALQLSMSPLVEMGYACSFMFVNASAPKQETLGLTNGLAQMAASIIRAFAPMSSNTLYSLTIEGDLLGGLLVYVVMISVALVAFRLTFFLPRSAITRL